MPDQRATIQLRPRDDMGADPLAAAEPADVLSVIVPVLQDGDDDLTRAHRAYRRALGGRGPVEFLYVLATRLPRALAALTALKEAGEPIVVVALSRSENEAAALRSGFAYARGDTILTLSPYPQVEPAELPRVLDALDACDMVVARRGTVADSRADSVQVTVFHWLIRRLFGYAFGDLVCRVRACRRPVFEEIAAYGSQHQFLPLLAAERGFRLREIEVRQRHDVGTLGRPSSVFARMRLMLDILALFVVLKFIRKPLRFFGALGLPILLVGLAYTSFLAASRVFLDTGLADRPALILGVLLIVLGIQVIALGLIGEIIIFASGKRIKDYQVEKVL